ncbi:Doublesex- and mab-3-related transcription factor dmd-3 [Caenorhabditis elegans]|uniref:Doublesex- and mab-3-related transcription factor dmd-3 n=1 Tax=Caenorhabditis elegans TaxID=6239 RepID=DMD3_CAEEL|nr:Doublesex- and mab-3-related transcription factor dmd-3 [Caenorhabditis elegans]Q9XWN9.2 RecName: Full=Doublesex- and mab-3-related transcription factor dmd-3; AltName: Full=Doublesex-like 3 protein homolog [Caenorhabditis elegans]CAA21612.2 Doublesex- and mab-3-related transcription factor dmd-3 [Caenorhabditis elegans]|eukprot:NP_001256882.1 DM (Doublesex/MAB-3) Domain family [Caenorhabditis elegans]
MNIEEILPELFGEKRVYYCQRCLNHGLREKRKNHKLSCTFRFCQCSNCIMVERRRQLNSRLMQIDGSRDEKPMTTLTMALTCSEEDQMECTSQSETTNESSGEDKDDGKPKERRPNCQRCAQHSVVNRLKGHKRACPFRDCFCAKCQVVVERQKLMADQIKLRRRQKREKNNLNSEREAPIAHSMTPSPIDTVTTTTTPTSETSTPMCLKCAQQVIGYQQLLSLLDPSATLQDPMITLSAVLSACPHKNE